MQPGTRLLSGPENRCALSIGSEQDDGPLVSQVPESLMKLSGSMSLVDLLLTSQHKSYCFFSGGIRKF